MCEPGGVRGEGIGDSGAVALRADSGRGENGVLFVFNVVVPAPVSAPRCTKRQVRGLPHLLPAPQLLQLPLQRQRHRLGPLILGRPRTLLQHHLDLARPLATDDRPKRKTRMFPVRVNLDDGRRVRDRETGGADAERDCFPGMVGRVCGNEGEDEVALCEEDGSAAGGQVEGFCGGDVDELLGHDGVLRWRDERRKRWGEMVKSRRR